MIQSYTKQNIHNTHIKYNFFRVSPFGIAPVKIWWERNVMYKFYSESVVFGDDFMCVGITWKYFYCFRKVVWKEEWQLKGLLFHEGPAVMWSTKVLMLFVMNLLCSDFILVWTAYCHGENMQAKWQHILPHWVAADDNPVDMQKKKNPLLSCMVWIVTRQWIEFRNGSSLLMFVEIINVSWVFFCLFFLICYDLFWYCMQPF